MSLSKPLVDSELFCSKHTDCDAPISVITEIISENCQKRYRIVSQKFDELGFTKVKDLARSINRKADRDALAPLYRAMKIFSERQDNVLKSEKSEKSELQTDNIQKKIPTHKPTDLNVILRMAKSYFDSGRYDECLDWLEKGKKIDPCCTDVLYNFALVYMKKSENDLAKDYLFEACSIKPYCVDPWTNYADFLFETNDLEIAELAYVRVLSLDPKLYKVRNEYGKLLFKLNKIEEAKEEFEIAHNSEKKCPASLHNLADVYYLCGEFEKSILRYKQVLELDPDSLNVYSYLGMAYLKIKEYQNALNVFTQAIAKEPANVYFLEKLAVTYCLLGDMVSCAETYKKCLKVKPEYYKVNLDLALVYLQNIKNYQEAVVYLKKCIQLHPDGIDQLIDLYTKLIRAYMKSKDYLNASDACMSMGDLFLEKDDKKNARIAFYQAAVMGNAFGHWKLAITIRNDPGFGSDSVLQRFQHAVELKPNLINVMMSLSSGIQDIKDKMQWCSSWWCPKHGCLKKDMLCLNPETPEEEEEGKKVLGLAIKRQKHWITKTKVRCCVFDRKSGTDQYPVPPDCYSKYLSDLVKTGDGRIKSSHCEADLKSAASFLQNLEKMLLSSSGS